MIVPYYEVIHQGGLELQWTKGPWLWKLEGIARDGQGPFFVAVTGGLERTLATLAGKSDLTLFLEYSYDGRDNQTFTLYENDLFAAARLSLNDTASTEATVGLQVNVISGDLIGIVKFQSRLRENWKAALEARLFQVVDQDDPLYWFRRDHHIEVTLRYFY